MRILKNNPTPQPKACLWLVILILAAFHHAQAQSSCPTVHDLPDFLPAWTNAVIGPGNRSHQCTLALLTPDARITGVEPDKTPGKDGHPNRIVETPDQFVAWYQNHPDQTFWERTTHSTIAVYENVARVTRTYEVRSTPTGPVTSTGIEDFQLIFDGKEWRAFSLLWQDATPGKPLPPGYLP